MLYYKKDGRSKRVYNIGMLGIFQGGMNNDSIKTECPNGIGKDT